MSASGSIEQVRLCGEEDVPVRQGKIIRVADRPLAVFHTDDGFRVIDNTCTHMGGHLADGLVADETVACPLHDRRFDLATGRAVGHDCGAVAVYPVEVRDDGVYASIPVFDLGDDQAAVGGGGTDTAVTDDDREAQEDAADEAPDSSLDVEESEEGTTNSVVTEEPLPAKAERPIEAKAGLREPENAQS